MCPSSSRYTDRDDTSAGFELALGEGVAVDAGGHPVVAFSFLVFGFERVPPFDILLSSAIGEDKERPILVCSPSELAPSLICLLLVESTSFFDFSFP